MTDCNSSATRAALHEDGTMTFTTRRTLAVALAALSVSLAAPQSIRAQQYSAVTGPRWRAWLGCWSAAPADTSRFLPASSARIVCVAPTADADVVEVSAVSDGKVLSRDRIDASGRARTVDIGGCTGSESARWSADLRRVFLKSAVTCDGVLSEMSAMLAINAMGEWLDVRSTSAGGGPANLRVAHYRDAGLPDGIPADISRALSERRMSTLAARIAAGTPVGASAIIEATRIVDGSIVEAWTHESGQRFAVDARALTELADAGVPASVTDAMIAVSNRTALANDRADDISSRYDRRGCGVYGCYGRGSSDYWDQGTGQRIYITVYPPYDPWGFGYWPFGRHYDRGVLGYAPYGYAPYGYVPYGYGGWGYSYGDNYRGRSVTGYYYPPTIVLHANQGGTEPRGRSEKGNGYTPGERTAGSPSAPPVRTATPRTTPPSSSPPAHAPEPARNGSEGGRNDSGGRTAKARP